MKPSEYPEHMLKTLVRLWEAPDGVELRVRGAVGTWLAFQSSILSLGKAGSEDYSCNEKHEICVAVDELVDRQFITTQIMTFEPERRGIKPTPEGIDHARKLMRPWLLKAFDFIKGDVRAIIVAVITAVVITIVTTIIMKVLGWL